MRRTRIRRVSKKALDERVILKALRDAVFERWGHACLRCGDDTSDLHIHHLLPRSRGGKHEESNLRPLCWPCHDLIHRHLAPDWMDFID